MKTGFIEKTNILLSSKKLKKFKYEKDCLKDDCNIQDFEVSIKIEADKFYRFIEFLNKIKSDRVIFKVDKEDRYLELSSGHAVLKIETLYPIEENAECKYSVEYLIALLKEYKIKDFQNEFIEFWFSGAYPLKIKLKNDWYILSPIIND